MFHYLKLQQSTIVASSSSSPYFTKTLKRLLLLSPSRTLLIFLVAKTHVELSISKKNSPFFGILSDLLRDILITSERVSDG